MGKWWRIKYRTSVNRALILTGSVLLKILKEKKNIFICTRILSVILSRPVTQRLQWYRPRRGGHPSLWMAFPLSSRVPIRGRWYSQCPFPACCFLLPWFDHKSTRTMFIRWPLVDIERNKNIDDILHVPLYALLQSMLLLYCWCFRYYFTHMSSRSNWCRLSQHGAHRFVLSGISRVHMTLSCSLYFILYACMAWA